MSPNKVPTLESRKPLALIDHILAVLAWSHQNLLIHEYAKSVT